MSVATRCGDSRLACDRELNDLVGDTGLEPVTSSVSGKRASQTAPIARGYCWCLEVETGFEPV